MENLKTNLYYALGSVYVPKKIIKNKEKKLLHISDTPQNFFPSLSKIIKKIKPQYIIHTGDLVDNIKLGFYPQKIEDYKKGVKNLKDILEYSPTKEIYITLGNHDQKEIVEDTFTRSFITHTSDIIKIENLQFKISHYSQEIIKEPAKYNLFGHDLALNSKIENERIFLNGIKSINIITLDSEQIFTLPYPIGTNDSRLGKFKIGI